LIGPAQLLSLARRRCPTQPFTGTLLRPRSGLTNELVSTMPFRRFPSSSSFGAVQLLPSVAPLNRLLKVPLLQLVLGSTNLHVSPLYLFHFPSSSLISLPAPPSHGSPRFGATISKVSPATAAKVDEPVREYSATLTFPLLLINRSCSAPVNPKVSMPYLPLNKVTPAVTSGVDKSVREYL
jgi:hypothetical protein